MQTDANNTTATAGGFTSGLFRNAAAASSTTNQGLFTFTGIFGPRSGKEAQP